MAVKTKPKRSTKREPLLPEKLSDCLAVALGDLIKCERQKGTYRIYMMTFHQPNSHCTVCLAGAAMAQTLGVPPTEPSCPSGFNQHNNVRLNAISNCAISSLADGLQELGLEVIEGAWKRTPSYASDPKAFKAAIRSYIKELRAKGL